MVRGWSYDEGITALNLLNDILAGANTEELMPVLRQLVIAAGGIDVVAEKAKLSTDRLAQILAVNDDPSLWDVMDVLSVLGLRLSLRAAS